MPDSPHSAEYLGDYRDYWWNADFLALIARRWQLDTVTSALDVGCGHGHWGRALLPHLPAARLTGIDPEPKWIDKAREHATAKGLAHRTEYLEGSAEHIPFPDNTFDLVTCQTVLMHVPDPAVAIDEMLRVLRPGGRLFAVEPNNAANSMVRISTRRHESIDERMRLVRFQALCERGKAQLGKGDSSIGDELPELFYKRGLEDVQVYHSDSARPLIPPYSAPGQRILVDQVLRWAGKDIWIWDREETLKCYLAGGGPADEFDPLWQQAMKVTREEAQAMRDQSFISPGGSMNYLVSGLKPRRNSAPR
jgi:SAM-dependent methyltransferase